MKSLSKFIQGNFSFPGSVVYMIKSKASSYVFFFMLGEDFKNEIHALQKAMYEKFIQEEKLPVYDPDEFYNFCRSVNAQNVFDFIFSTFSSTRHSKDRKELNRKRTVAFLCEFCFCLSQKCYSLQKDNGIFMKFCHLTDEGLDTQRRIGTSLCSCSLKRKIIDSAKSSGDLFKNMHSCKFKQSKTFH